MAGPAPEEGLVARIRAIIGDQPTHGYRRVWATLKREGREKGLAPVNAERVYRVINAYGMLLRRHAGRAYARRHDGKIAVAHSNLRWCSDGFELACDNGDKVRVAFAHEIGLEPLTMRVTNPQSNGLAEAFVRTIKRDYARVHQTPDARAVIERLPLWFDHYNGVHPHSALRYRSQQEVIASHSNGTTVSDL